jgi:hypothetical protein
MLARFSVICTIAAFAIDFRITTFDRRRRAVVVVRQLQILRGLGLVVTPVGSG